MKYKIAAFLLAFSFIFIASFASFSIVVNGFTPLSGPEDSLREVFMEVDGKTLHFWQPFDIEGLASMDERVLIHHHDRTLSTRYRVTSCLEDIPCFSVDSSRIKIATVPQNRYIGLWKTPKK